MKFTELFVCVLFIFNVSSTNIKLTDIHEKLFHDSDANVADERVKVIIDTDGVVDDAMAILMALAEPRLDILAITTVVGNTNLTQCNINVLKTLRVVNSTVPVYSGAEESLIFTPPTDYFYGDDGFGDVLDPNPPSLEQLQEENAVFALIRLVHEHPQEITIVALGPMTNLALAMRLDPSFKKTVKHIIWVGGSVEGIGNVSPGIEFNAYSDPASNFVTFNEPGPLITLSPWEVSYKKTAISVDWRRNVLGVIDTPRMKFLNAIQEKSLAAGYWSPIDSKTIAMVMNPSLITERHDYFVEFVWEGDGTRGMTVVDYVNSTKREANADVVLNMDGEVYKEMCLKYFSVDLNH